MKPFAYFIFPLLLLAACKAAGPAGSPVRAIVSGVAWFDRDNNEVNAHGACIVKENDLYYLFGEYKTDTSNAFVGFACYSSSDLVDWTFEKLVLPRQADGLLGPGRVGERPKVMKSPSTGEFVMYMHCDNLGYTDQYIGYATCPTVNGDYEFRGPLLTGDGKPVRKWDMGAFQDSDGRGYLLTHSGFIYSLSDDYRSVDSIVVQDVVHGESPAIFKHNGTYYWLFSNLTSWERNDNFYMTATSLTGPWTKQGLIAPEGKRTWNSQTTFILPLDTMFMFMGDRWSYPVQGSAATYVWQPVTISPDGLLMPEFHQAWRPWEDVDILLDEVKTLEWNGNWKAAGKSFTTKEAGASMTASLRGRQVALYGVSTPVSGYASLTIIDGNGQEVVSTILDFYSQYETSGIKFLSPVLENGNHTVRVEALGRHSSSQDKRGNHFGSTDDYVTITGISYVRP